MPQLLLGRFLIQLMSELVMLEMTQVRMLLQLLMEIPVPLTLGMLLLEMI